MAAYPLSLVLVVLNPVRMQSLIGFLGLGRMGEPMALNLLRAGTPLLVWNRSPGKDEEVRAAGGRVAESADEVFARVSVVIAMLADGAALDDVTGRGTAAFARNLQGRVLVQMGTTAPAWSAALEEDVRAVGGRYVESPVSGSRKPAEAGQLVGMLAGDPDTVAEVRPILEPMLQRSVVCGAVPDALRMKLAANIFLITEVTGLAESFHFAERHGLDLAVLREVLDSGQMASAISRLKLGMLIAGDFPPQAAVRDVHYNSELIVAAARELGIASPLLDASNALFAEAERRGHGEEDMAAVVHALDATKPVPRIGATG